MRDILPDEVELRDAAVREIVAVYRAYGFRRIETPALPAAARARGGPPALRVGTTARRLLEVPARHCGFPDSAHGAFFIVFDKLDRLGAEGVLAELREGGHHAGPLRRFEALLPALQKEELSLDGLRAALAGTKDPSEVTGAWDSLATIIATANAEIAAGCRVRFDPTLVRGMGYYTGPIFEIAAAAYPSSIAGGGRYDRMIGRLLGREVPASGFSIGFERLISILAQRGGVPAREGAAAPERRGGLLCVDRAEVPAAGRAGP